MLGIHRELLQLVLEHSFNKYLLSPIWVPGIMILFQALRHLWMLAHTYDTSPTQLVMHRVNLCTLTLSPALYSKKAWQKFLLKGMSRLRIIMLSLGIT